MAHEDDDIRLFREQVVDVTPLETDVGKPASKGNEATPGQQYRRQAAQRSVQADRNFLSTEFVTLVHPLEILSFKRDGVQYGVFKKLKKGKYDVEGILDLHRMSVEKARVELYEFILECERRDIRSVMINHGKGARNLEHPAVIKSCVAKWLPQLPQVIAFHSAQRHHGGVGVLYTLLRKSENLKTKTRQRFGGR